MKFTPRRRRQRVTTPSVDDHRVAATGCPVAGRGFHGTALDRTPRGFLPEGSGLGVRPPDLATARVPARHRTQPRRRTTSHRTRVELVFRRAGTRDLRPVNRSTSPRSPHGRRSNPRTSPPATRSGDPERTTTDRTDLSRGRAGRCSVVVQRAADRASDPPPRCFPRRTRTESSRGRRGHRPTPGCFSPPTNP